MDVLIRTGDSSANDDDGGGRH